MKKSKFYFFVMLFLAVVFGSQAFAFSLPKMLRNFQHINVDVSGNNIEIYLAELSPSYRVKIYQQPADKQINAKSILELSKEYNFNMAVNGGFYSTDFKPVGLFIEKGRVEQRLSHAELLESCVYVEKHKLFLSSDRGSCINKNSAMQGGPVLIKNGQANKNLDLLEKKLPKLVSFFSMRRRTVLAESYSHKIFVLISPSATLQDMVIALKKSPEFSGQNIIQTAIDLDGGGSTAMYIRSEPKPFYFPETRHVKTFLFFD